MVLGIGFLLIVSLVASAALAALGKLVAPLFGGWAVLAEALNFVVSFALMTVIFAMIYKIMPRVRIGWRDVWVGAAVTALLFTIGKSLIGLYIGRSGVRLGLRRRRLAGRAAGLDVLLGADLPARRRVHLGLCAHPRRRASNVGAEGAARAGAAAGEPDPAAALTRSRTALEAAMQSPTSPARSLRPIDMRRPNIVFIVADDLGFADLGCYGGRGVRRCRRCSTGWRRNGLRFTQGYANSPVCSPTRFALMTGALPVPAARRGRGADQQQEPRQHHARPAARAPDPALAAARGRLPHRADRQVAPGLSAARSGRCARATRSSSGRCRAASTTSATAIRAARTTCGSARRSTARRATSPT